MAFLTLYKDTYSAATMISNSFIDYYMKDANDAQLKVYLYLMRKLTCEDDFTISDIADQFNHTEKDILRALNYWAEKGLLTLEYDAEGMLTGIRPEPPGKPASGTAASAPVSVMMTPQAAAPAAKELFQKPQYSLDQLAAFRDQENTSSLIFIAESYMERPLKAQEITSLLFFTDVLCFSEDLIDYLLQYCIGMGKKSFHYIDAVAVKWAEAGVKTPEDAKLHTGKYDKQVYDILKQLGRTSAPTDAEVEYIHRWTKEYGFSNDIIFEACNRTVLATDKNRFAYAEKILAKWKAEKVSTRADIEKVDSTFQKKKPRPAYPAQGNTNKFNQFTQNTYDFAEIEKKLLSN